MFPYRQIENQEVMWLSSHCFIKDDDCYNEDISQETNNYDQRKQDWNNDWNHCRQDFQILINFISISSQREIRLGIIHNSEKKNIETY